MLVTLELVGEDEPRSGRDWVTLPDGRVTGRVVFGPWPTPRVFDGVRVSGADAARYASPVEVPTGMVVEQGLVATVEHQAAGMAARTTTTVRPDGSPNVIAATSVAIDEYVPSTVRSDLPTQDEFERAGIALLGIDEPLAIRMLNASERVASDLPALNR